MNLKKFCSFSIGFFTLCCAMHAATSVGVPPIYEIKTFGAVGDGVADDTQAIVNALGSGKNIHFPKGTYNINNSGGPLVFANFSSVVMFDSGAQLLFMSPNQLGLQFTGGEGAKFMNLSVGYKQPPSNRTPGSVINFTNTTDTYLSGATVTASAGGGISFQSCVRPVVVKTNISNTLADGLFFQNCQSAVVDGLVTNNTGDDALAIHNFLTGPQESNGSATNIQVTNSRARGISCSGCKDLTVSNFTVQNTSAQGVQLDHDMSYPSYQPTNVIVKNGTVTNAGMLSPTIGNGFGIELDDTLICALQNIQVNNSAGRGVDVGSPSGTTTIAGVQVSGTGSGTGFDLQGLNITLLDSGAQNTSQQCVAVTNSEMVTLDNVTATDCNKSGGLHRAVDLELINHVVGSTIQITDNQSSATGYLYFDWSVNSGFIQNVSYSVSHGTFSLSSNSPGVQVASLTNLAGN